MFPILDVLATLRIDELLGQAKVDDVDNVLVRCSISTHEKVLWLHITIDQVLTMNILDSCYLCHAYKGGKVKRRRQRERERKIKTNERERNEYVIREE